MDTINRLSSGSLIIYESMLSYEPKTARRYLEFLRKVYEGKDSPRKRSKCTANTEKQRDMRSAESSRIMFALLSEEQKSCKQLAAESGMSTGCARDRMMEFCREGLAKKASIIRNGARTLVFWRSKS